MSSLISLSKLVVVCHEASLVSCSFVICLAVSSGMDVKRETTSKDIMHDFVWFKFKVFNIGEESISVVNSMG